MRALRPQLVMEVKQLPARRAWLMIGGGLLGVLAGIGLSMTVGGWFYLATIASAVIFFLGVNGLGARGVWLMAPAFVIGVIGPTVLAVLGHQAALRQFGREETCVVAEAEPHLDVKRPYIDYALDCPLAGRIELRLPAGHPLPEDQPTQVLTRPPLEPLIAKDVSYNGWLLVAIPAAMALLVAVAAAVRRRT
ncbi:hypothetical protein Lesp02_78900 [Lentzea sp. NBRC 105346]|uniref:hypothetical protein n=1 Tax=Lentzea sp. NBRC 105346 TaxID=3032205 RepID=UPI0024A2C1C5|nr:hypothetical protein [Lentzea sp. NBRC 105346]GLZ35703.1 hypothetical protein Lesp02_78900 [Lentzea sp. NBRC 105346]